MSTQQVSKFLVKKTMFWMVVDVRNVAFLGQLQFNFNSAFISILLLFQFYFVLLSAITQVPTRANSRLLSATTQGPTPEFAEIVRVVWQIQGC